jgi:hypothetical protein
VECSDRLAPVERKRRDAPSEGLDRAHSKQEFARSWSERAESIFLVWTASERPERGRLRRVVLGSLAAVTGH